MSTAGVWAGSSTRSGTSGKSAGRLVPGRQNDGRSTQLTSWPSRYTTPGRRTGVIGVARNAHSSADERALGARMLMHLHVCHAFGVDRQFGLVVRSRPLRCRTRAGSQPTVGRAWPDSPALGPSSLCGDRLRLARPHAGGGLLGEWPTPRRVVLVLLLLVGVAERHPVAVPVPSPTPMYSRRAVAGPDVSSAAPRLAYASPAWTTLQGSLGMVPAKLERKLDKRSLDDGGRG